jgi:malonyl-ACP decarboxylase
VKLSANALADPSFWDEARVMEEALAQAGREPQAVDYVNAHATSTPAGDAAELRALRHVFGGAFHRPWINATKALTGHCLGAAGVLEAVATVVQMAGGFVHPNPHLEEPIDADARFVPRRAQQVPIRVALSNSFGFGGFHSAVVLTAS